jgi:hypothetical protein
MAGKWAERLADLRLAQTWQATDKTDETPLDEAAKVVSSVLSAPHCSATDCSRWWSLAPRCPTWCLATLRCVCSTSY